jgi:hypothetical protein
VKSSSDPACSLGRDVLNIFLCSLSFLTGTTRPAGFSAETFSTTREERVRRSQNETGGVLRRHTQLDQHYNKGRKPPAGSS